MRAMRIDERIASNAEPAFSFEFFPPKTPEGEANLADALAELARLDPTFVSVTYGAGGTPAQREKTIEIVSRIKADHGLEAMAHFTCVGQTVNELRTTLDHMRDAGIQNVLALRGDPPAGVDAREWVAADGGLRYSRELIELIRADYDFSVGAACFPEVHLAAESAESDLRYTREKVDAGARFLITQLFFDNQLYYDFVARARDIGIDVPIIPGIMPFTNVAQIRRFTQMCGASIPQGLLRELELRTEQSEAVADFGVAYATMQCADLLANGAPGIHFYTLNRSPSTRAILSALRCLAPWRRAVIA
jgi:methylenetetrahydrofolate reductase (NADPH)